MRSTRDEHLARMAETCAVAELIAAHDWSATPLGAIERWPTELWSTVQIVLSSQFPLMLTWGPQRIKLYNDAYAALIGPDKHPAALGAPAEEVWHEIWDTIGPLFDSVHDDAATVWVENQQLVFERAGYSEECYFTFSYSPLFDSSGAVAGLLDIATETTPTVLAQRQQACIVDLSTALFSAEATLDVYRVAAAVLGRCPDLVAAADLYLCLDEELVLISSNRRGQARPSTRYEDLTDVVVLEGGSGDLPATEVAVPVGRYTDGPMGAAVLSLNPRRAFDQGYLDFVTLIGRTIGAALEQADRHATEIDQYRQIGDTLQQAMLQPASDLATVAARYLPASGHLAVGGDWYDVIELADDQRALVVGDCVGHGLDAAAAMSQLRSAARSTLLQGLDPAATIDALDRFAQSVPGAMCATVTCVVIDRRTGMLTYSSAGHLPALVISSGDAIWLDSATSPPLAVTSISATNATHQLLADDLVVLYTDGLIERRGESIDEGLTRLAAVATDGRSSTVHELADRLVDELVPTDTLDDIVVVVKRLEGASTR